MCLNGWESEYDFSTNADLRIPSKHPKCNKSGKISSSVNVSALSSDLLVATGNEDVIDWADLGGT